MMPDIFEPTVVTELINRINKINAESRPLWGKMDAGQMVAHCSVTYEMIYEDIHPQPGFLKKWLLRLLIKPVVTGEKGYPKSVRTASEFIITGTKDVEKEKARLINYMKKTQELGKAHFEGKSSHSFGRLTAIEWNNMMYKHLDHHLQQFGC